MLLQKEDLQIQCPLGHQLVGRCLQIKSDGIVYHSLRYTRLFLSTVFSAYGDGLLKNVIAKINFNPFVGDQFNRVEIIKSPFKIFN
uniref:Uncharacterized protein n=1 Tax=Romanomermis culicivorax TaxID=13658 RepID=A0A915JQA7_ROMCU